ncbi:flagellar protein export ATPase FliI [Pelagibaculum spongiae]|uniref:Flagellum-specific ATP synthase n=1 Tax=Pelagibaculum spongiae TaxID=2080658 RepID=A0A2V1GR66_9GAMM|nr:flagellar protein export ATPase FliI [Pelagibaculum spongiae]PVZ66722.1 flagellar protein export ATPase FliI [Pelagibaculum spongiae]
MQDLIKKLQARRQDIESSKSGLQVSGKLTRMVGLTLEAQGCVSPVGSRCKVESASGESSMAEVVGFDTNKLFLMPIGPIEGLTPGAKIIPTGETASVPVGDMLLGRVLDGAGKPLDGKGPLIGAQKASLTGKPINPLGRAPIEKPLDVGIRAINALLTVGRGQRMGLFAGTGVGKSVLLGMMTRHTEADVIVVGLIGERGREVKEFIDHILGPEGLRRSVVVAAPADESPLMRLQGAMTATAIAEYFRDQGLNVLLLMDSLTRFAQAQRELALAIGEPPATRGYPPSVFAKLPALVERAGNGLPGGGSITAIYTVLTEGDDQQDPIADSARGILDGHMVLSRHLAESGHYPAIDIEASVSRVMNQVVTPEQQQLALQLKSMFSAWSQSRDLISVGAYKQGSDSQVDQAIALMPKIKEFLQQDFRHSSNFEQSSSQLQQLMNSAS